MIFKALWTQTFCGMCVCVCKWLWKEKNTLDRRNILPEKERENKGCHTWCTEENARAEPRKYGEKRSCRTTCYLTVENFGVTVFRFWTTKLWCFTATHNNDECLWAGQTIPQQRVRCCCSSIVLFIAFPRNLQVAIHPNHWRCTSTGRS